MNFFCEETVSAKASDIASAQITLDVGAKLLGQASFVTEASRIISECFASCDFLLPVIAIISVSYTHLRAHET